MIRILWHGLKAFISAFKKTYKFSKEAEAQARLYHIALRPHITIEDAKRMDRQLKRVARRLERIKQGGN